MTNQLQRNVFRLAIVLLLAHAPTRMVWSQETSTDWWTDRVSNSLLESPQWVSFDMPTLLIDTLIHSPRIDSVKSAASIQLEQIVQQNAVFDSRHVLEGGYGQTNDPVGNTLVTGGPPRLRERSFTFSGGIRRNYRQGAVVDLSQEIGFLNSNSLFFLPQDQGNARLSLSLTQPLLAGQGRIYNERLLLQARIDGRTTWQQMRGEVTNRLVDVMSNFLALYEYRCHLVQQQDLIQRGRQIEQIVQGRQGFDVGRLALVKLHQRGSGRADRLTQDEALIRQTQSRLRWLVGSTELNSDAVMTEMIPSEVMDVQFLSVSLGDALQVGLENQPSVKAAMTRLESAGLGIRVAKNQLLPRLDAVLNAYLAGLNGRNAVFQSFGDQFVQSGPGISALLQYEMPRGNRSARSQHRAAMLAYRQATSELEETVQQLRSEIETALVRVKSSELLRVSNRRTLRLAVEEEAILTERYALLGPDGGVAGVVLEQLLDAQQRRTDAERTLVTTKTEFHVALIELQRAMGTLLRNEGVEPVRVTGSNTVHWTASESTASETSGSSHEERLLSNPPIHAEGLIE